MLEKISPQATHWMKHLDSNQYDLSLIQKACEFASGHENDAQTPFSLSTLTQGLAIADVLKQLQCDSTAIAAAIIYPTIFYQPALITQLSDHFDKTIFKMIAGAIQMEMIHSATIDKNDKDKNITGQQNQIDNLRKMMLAMVDDIRTVLLKLSERLVMLQHLGRCTPDIQKKIARETQDYYAPLANRLGVGHLKWQLEDYAFRYLNPAEYQSLAKAVNLRKKERDKIIHTILEELNTLLEKEGLKNTKISGRSKHLYSIYRKLERKQIGFENIYDASAVRILVPTLTDCYTALSIVHSRWTPISSEFDDYIAKPKTNGYQSIHTAIMYDQHIPIEIQIRTMDMHKQAELGIAAHWKYKENKSVNSVDEQKVLLLRDLLAWQKNTFNTDEMQSQMYRDVFSDHVYVFSPNGDVFDLPKGATPLDFAYLVHTNIGHRCRGAKINNVMVPLTYQLQNGDRIEIITSKEMHPSQDWARTELGFLKTAHALQKVRQWFRKLHQEKNLAEGQRQWEKIARQHNFEKSLLETIAKDFNLKTPDALLIALGSGNISPGAILNKLQGKPKSDSIHDEITIVDNEKIKQVTTNDLSVAGSKNLLTQLARCCHPIPGDEIIGYITKGRGITVHQRKCRNMIDIKKMRPEKLIEISWETQKEKKYHVHLIIHCEDRSGLLRDISAVIAQLNLSIFALKSYVNTKNDMTTIAMTLEIKDRAVLSEITRKLRQVNGVVEINRK